MTQENLSLQRNFVVKYFDKIHMGSFIHLYGLNVVKPRLRAHARLNIDKCHFLHCNGLCKEP
jgi:hypothetical protein